MTCSVCKTQLSMNDFCYHSLKDGQTCCSKDCCLKYLEKKCQEEEKNIKDIEWLLSKSKDRIFLLNEEKTYFINQ